MLRLEFSGNVSTDFFKVADCTGVQRYRRGAKGEIDRQVFRSSVHGYELVLFLEEQLGKFVGEIVGHVSVDNQHVGNTQRVDRLVNALVHAGWHRERGKDGLALDGVFTLFFRKRKNADGARCRQAHDRAGWGANAPETRINVAVAQGVGRLVKVKTLCAEIVLGDAVAFENGTRVDFGSATRGTDRYALALEVLQRLDIAVAREHDLNHVRVNGSQSTGVFDLATAFELALTVVCLVGGVCQNQSHTGVTTMDQGHVFYRCTGNFSYGTVAIKILTDDFGKTATDWVVHPARSASGDRQGFTRLC